MTNEYDTQIEDLLSRYRPVGPPATLRSRVLAAAQGRAPRLGLMPRFAAAAAVALGLGLQYATERVSRESVAALGVGRIEWTRESDEYAQMLDGGGAGYRYISRALAADTCRSKEIPFRVPIAGIPGAEP